MNVEPNLVTRTALLLALLSMACQGGVEHPKPGEPNTKDYCGDRPREENNCMACSSQPGCGYCNEPQPGEAHCQPGASGDRPKSCISGWAQSTEECAAPPPPPPP